VSRVPLDGGNCALASRFLVEKVEVGRQAEHEPVRTHERRREAVERAYPGATEPVERGPCAGHELDVGESRSMSCPLP